MERPRRIARYARVPATLLTILACSPSGPALAQASALLPETRPHTETPLAFLEGLYEPYRQGHANFPSAGQDPSLLFAPALASLIREDNDEAAARGEVTALDQDPFCDCQDFDRLEHLSIDVRSPAAGRTQATVRFMNSGFPTTVRYTLVHTPSGWRIADLAERDIPSLLAFMTKAVPLAHR